MKYDSESLLRWKRLYNYLVLVRHGIIYRSVQWKKIGYMSPANPRRCRIPTELWTQKSDVQLAPPRLHSKARPTLPLARLRLTEALLMLSSHGMSYSHDQVTNTSIRASLAVQRHNFILIALQDVCMHNNRRRLGGSDAHWSYCTLHPLVTILI
jgi:hypothetical protein